MLKFETYPDEWKTANWALVAKPAKGNYGIPGSYRPILLLSCFDKIFESIIAKRIAAVSIQCGAISQDQMGARTHHSAIDTSQKIIDPLSKCLFQRVSKNQTKIRPAVLTLDIDGALNNTDLRLLVQNMN